MKLQGMSLAQKLIAKAAQRDSVKIGEIVNCDVDLAMFHDSSGPRRLQPMLNELNAQIWDKNKVVLVLDHYVPAQDPQAHAIVELTRQVAKQWQLPNVIDSQGICHVVVPERGLLKPGMFCVGGDSHSPTGGAFGCYMFGIGATEMLGVCVTGQIWIQVPDTLLLRWDGKLADGVCAKDMMLYMIGELGINGAGYRAVEFAGTVVESMSMAERMTLCNMSAELGAQTGLIGADLRTRDFLRTAGVDDSQLESVSFWQSDADAPMTRHQFNASTLEPQVAMPHSPANTYAVGQIDLQPTVAYIGACTGAKLEDLRAAARILRGRKIAQSMTLLVAPASAREQQQAEREGTLGILTDAGASILPNSCGACAGYGSRFEENTIVISSTARNFKGRMGPDSVQVMLASPFTVAATALRGKVTDPREVLS